MARKGGGVIDVGLMFVLSVLHSTSCGDMIEVGGAGGVVEMTLPGWRCEFLSALVVFAVTGGRRRRLSCVEEAFCFSVSSRSVGQSDGINGWQHAE